MTLSPKPTPSIRKRRPLTKPKTIGTPNEALNISPPGIEEVAPPSSNPTQLDTPTIPIGKRRPILEFNLEERNLPPPISEDRKPKTLSVPTKKKLNLPCRACGGTGIASRGGPCISCMHNKLFQF